MWSKALSQLYTLITETRFPSSSGDVHRTVTVIEFLQNEILPCTTSWLPTLNPPASFSQILRIGPVIDFKLEKKVILFFSLRQKYYVSFRENELYSIFCGNWRFSLYFLDTSQSISRSQREKSELNSTGCSCRAPKISSQHPQSNSQSYSISFPGIQHVLLAAAIANIRCTYVQAGKLHTSKISKCLKSVFLINGNRKKDQFPPPPSQKACLEANKKFSQ